MYLQDFENIADTHRKLHIRCIAHHKRSWLPIARGEAEQYIDGSGALRQRLFIDWDSRAITEIPAGKEQADE